jgi:hypothetical protein
LSIRHPRLANGLYPLPADLPLTELVLEMRPEQRCLLGVGRWTSLETITAQGIPGVDEVRELGKLPVLRHLALDSVSPVDDLVRLRPLGALRIELFQIPRADAEAARDALPDADLVLHSVEDAPPADAN